MKKSPPRPVILCILDGWGHRESCDNNAICQARKPNLDRLFAAMPHALVDASEGEVGLPKGQMGNSEVGHMNLGAGRVVMQDLPRIDAAIADGSFAKNPVLTDAIAKLKQSGGTAHVMGLLSPGGVHSHQDQMAYLAEVLAESGIPVAVHAFLDGRDTPPRSALDYLKAFQAKAPQAAIATVSGRYYAMDRDKRWARVEQAYRAVVAAEGERAGDPLEAVEQSYAAGTSDEFVLPTVIGGYAGMRDGDGLFMANFRADRAREILTALLDMISQETVDNNLCYRKRGGTLIYGYRNQTRRDGHDIVEPEARPHCRRQLRHRTCGRTAGACRRSHSDDRIEVG